eukprot:Hpha_TRINITY_DN27899_c0_g1::TRINITY_DN27899_c0_g1_i1::g.194061::m.194061
MYSVNYGLERSKVQDFLDRESDRMEERIREHILGKYGHDDKRRPKEALRRIFAETDVDGTGKVNLAEFRQAMKKMNFVDQQDIIENLFERFDRDESGSLSYQEFSNGIWGHIPVPGSHPHCRAVIAKVRNALGRSVRSGANTLRKIDQNGDRRIERHELVSGLNAVGLELSPAEYDVIMEYFDQDGDGTLSVTEFLRAIRGVMNPWRRQLVDMAFGELDPSGDGLVTFAEAKRLFNSESHPDVVNGEKTQEEALAEFITGWDKDGDGTISREEFLEFYKDLSVAVVTDKEFEEIIRGSWHLAGNRAKRQAISTHATVWRTDGSRHEIDVTHLPGADLSSVRSVELALRKQGLDCIDKVSLRRT